MADETSTWLPATTIKDLITMTHSRVYAPRTYHDSVILSDTEDPHEGSQELTPKREATVMNQPLTLPEILLVLLVVGLSKIL